MYLTVQKCVDMLHSTTSHPAITLLYQNNSPLSIESAQNASRWYRYLQVLDDRGRVLVGLGLATKVTGDGL